MTTTMPEIPMAAPRTPEPQRPQANLTDQNGQKGSKETQTRVQEKQQQIAAMREMKEHAQQQKAEEKARAEQQAKGKMEEGIEELKQPIPDDSDTSQPIAPTDESIESQTLRAIAEGTIPPPAPKLQRIVYDICRRYNLDPAKPDDMAKVQDMMRGVIQEGKLYAYVQDGTDLGKAMRLAQISIYDLKTAYQKTYGEELRIDSVEQLDPANTEQLAKAIVAFEDITSSQEYIAKSYRRMNNTVKNRYLSIFAKRGATETTFNAAIEHYADKTLENFPPKAFSMLTLQRFFYDHQPEKQEVQIGKSQLDSEPPRNDLTHNEASDLATQTQAYIEKVLTDVQVSGTSITFGAIAKQAYTENQLAQAFIEKAARGKQGIEPTLVQNQQQVAQQARDIALLLNHAPDAEAIRIKQELVVLTRIENALQRSLAQTRDTKQAQPIAA